MSCDYKNNSSNIQGILKIQNWGEKVEVIVIKSQFKSWREKGESAAEMKVDYSLKEIFSHPRKTLKIHDVTSLMQVLYCVPNAV